MSRGRRILLAIIGVVITAIAVLAVVVALQPSDFAISRSRTMAAPAEAIFAQLQDLQAWQRWSPWEGLDPDMERTYGTTTVGVGASYGWKGDDTVGAGVMTITEATVPTHLGIDLVFTAPFTASNDVRFDLAETAEGTTVTWTMRGTNNFIGKAFCLVMDMDALVGGDFERGLAQLEAAAMKAEPTAP